MAGEVTTFWETETETHNFWIPTCRCYDGNIAKAEDISIYILWSNAAGAFNFFCHLSIVNCPSLPFMDCNWRRPSRWMAVPALPWRQQQTLDCIFYIGTRFFGPKKPNMNICSFPKMGDPPVTMGFNTKMVNFWMIWGTIWGRTWVFGRMSNHWGIRVCAAIPAGKWDDDFEWPMKVGVWNHQEGFQTSAISHFQKNKSRWLTLILG